MRKNRFDGALRRQRSGRGLRAALPLTAIFLALWALPAIASEAGGAEVGKAVFAEMTEMALIPEGDFLMGASEKNGVVGIEVGIDAMPAHTVRLKAFHIDRYEVTVAQYRRFMTATGRPSPLLWGPDLVPDYPAVDDYPVADVSWYDADIYCRWLGKRLPTEEEWEKAARGVDGRRFPWGNDWIDGAANSREYFDGRYTPGEKGFSRTVVKVGSMEGDVSPYGVHDMGGNVTEWTSSWYRPYPGSTLAREVFGEKVKVLRGGQWMAPSIPFSFAFNRHSSFPDGMAHTGFRCARDAE
jgi:formylglycine-generating enzyme required for sulfatase activity